jgi:hypothetical protein
MSYNTKNYRKQGGDEWVIGGKQAIKSGGEVDFETGSALKFEGEAIAAEQINAALALVGAMVGGYAAADHGDDTSTKKINVMAANGDGEGNRAVLIIVKCTETLAADGDLPTFQIGDGATVNKFAKIGNGGDPSTFAEGEIAVFAGTLTEESPVEIAVTDGTGDNEAGAIQVFVIALPVSA